MFVAGVAAGCYGGRDEGWFDPWALLEAFRQSSKGRGVHFITGKAAGFELSAGGLPSAVRLALKDDREMVVDCDRLVVAAGGDSGEVGRMLGVEIPVEKRKRYVYVPHCPAGPGMDCPLVIDPTGVIKMSGSE